MPYRLRFLQTYRPQDREAFLAAEARFVRLERDRPDLPQGRRHQPVTGRLATNTLIWECEFPTLADLHESLARLSADPQHGELFRDQVPYIMDAYTEIDEVLD